MQRARMLFAVGDPGSGVAEFKVNSGLFSDTRQARRDEVGVCLSGFACVHERVSWCRPGSVIRSKDDGESHSRVI